MLAASNGKGLADLCYQTRGDATQCKTNVMLGLDATASTLIIGDHVTSFAVTGGADATAALVLTTTGAATVDSATYILTGTPTSGSLKWVQTGSCQTAGLC